MSSKREISKQTNKPSLDKDSNSLKRDKTLTSYVEASSDDEFAREHFMYSSDEDSFTPKCGSKRQREPKSSKNEKEQSGSDDDDQEEKIDYRVERILARKSMTAQEWIAVTDQMNTREIIKGSVLQQPDEEYYDSSNVLVEKFLIKWAHASYLHVSWETQKDLEDLAGKGIKHSIKKFLQREVEGRELFEDLAQGEYFPSSFLQIERILDVDDKDITVATIRWDTVGLPEIIDESAPSDGENTPVDADGENFDGAAEINADQESSHNVGSDESVNKKGDSQDSGSEDDPFAISDEEEEVFPVRRGRRATGKKICYVEDSEDEDLPAKGGEIMDIVDSSDEHSHSDSICRNKSSKHSQHQSQKSMDAKKKKKTMKKNQYLHGENCWVTVKWEGLSYSEVSFESLNDIIRRKIDYESQLRMFYKREQAPAKESHLNGPRKLNLDHTIIGPTAEQPPFPGGELRDYQWEGVRWMLFNLMQGRNSILADEMGLGKTIQSSALLHMLKKHQKSAGPFLVVAPLSTIVNWQREVRTWTNLDAIMYYGSQDDRELIRSYEFNFLDKKKKGYKVEVVITTPETCMATDEKSAGRVKRVLSRIGWDLIIVDEAHKLKNYDSKLSSTLREEYSYRNCVLLTGTPLQNNTEELWTLLNFVGPTDFADHEEFMEKFGDLKSTTQLEELHRRIKPYLLRREKDNVEKTVPPKEEIVIEVELTVPQKQYYRAIFEQKTGFLYRANMKDGPSLTNLAMELRKCCNHPYLIKGAPVEIAKHFKDDSHQDILVKSSGKMTLLAKLLPKLRADGHRVLIFSQFRMMLDIIEDCIHHAGYTYERVDGSIVGNKRQAAIDRFTKNDNIFIMLLSTKAGGVGINLTAADTVIIYDSDWNPQNDIQAQARAHRIGQTRSVTVYRLLTRKTYEMAMFRAASIKLGLDYAVMHNLNQSAPTLMPATTKGRGRGSKQQQQQQLAGISNERADTVSALSRRELENLLKHGAYDIFMEEKDGKSENESKTFVEESIEQILERSSIFMHQENDSKVQCMKPTSSFAKASFVSAAGNSDAAADEVAIDDPDFWSKVVGLSVEDQAIALGAKRKCRQNVESYKEPGMSIKSIYGERKNAYVSDSDDDSDEEGRGSKRRRKNAAEEPEIVPAEYSIDNLQSILTAMVNHGYGAWSAIRRATKLWWKDSDIAKACTFNVLGNLLLASMTNLADEKKQTSRKSSDINNNAVNDEIGDGSDMAVDELNATSSSSTSYKFDANVFLILLKRYKGCKVAVASYLLQNSFKETDSEVSSIAVLEDQLLSQFISKMNNLCFDQPLPSLAIRTAFQSAMVSSMKERQGLSTENDEEKILAIWISDFVSSFSSHEIGKDFSNLCTDSDMARLQKRVATAKSKLAQVEDLFEAHFYEKYAQKVAIDTNMAAPVQKGTELMKEEAISVNRENNTVETVPAPEPLRANVLKQLSNTEDNESVASGWSIEHDHSLLIAVDRHGAPDGKRRYMKIMEYLADKHADIEYVSPIAAAASAAVTIGNNEEPVAVVEGQTAESAATNSEESPTSSSTLVNAGIHEKYTPKFLSGRWKFLARMIRCTDEDLAALAKQEAAAAAAIAKQQAAEAKAKAAEKQLRKKHVQQVFKTIGRVGYPRSAYVTISENLASILGKESEEFSKRAVFLLSWEAFLKECDVASTLDISELQEIVYKSISILNNPEEIGGVEGICTSGILEDVSHKTIDAAFEKVDTLHHIRVLLALHSQDDLKQLIKSSCKVAGPDVPTFRRDSTMPVWWTLQHDLELLKLCLSLGLCQWKKLVAEPLMSTAPADFEMPPKTHGTEWVLALTAKNAEKRIQSLLRGLPAMRTLSLPAPASPQRKSTQRVLSASSGINTLAAAFGNVVNSVNSGNGTNSGTTSWFCKATSVSSSTAKTAPAAVVSEAKDTSATDMSVTVVTAEPATMLVVVEDIEVSPTIQKQSAAVDDDIVTLTTPLKISSTPSFSLTNSEEKLEVTAAQALQSAIIVDNAVEVVLGDLTPSRADELSATKVQTREAILESNQDASAEKIELLVSNSNCSAVKENVTAPVIENKPPVKVQSSAKKVGSKKAEKSVSEVPATKSILSFFKRA